MQAKSSMYKSMLWYKPCALSCNLQRSPERQAFSMYQKLTDGVRSERRDRSLFHEAHITDVEHAGFGRWHHQTQGGPLALSIRAPSKTRNGPLVRPSFRSQWFGRSTSKHGVPKMSLGSWFGLPFLGLKKNMGKYENRKEKTLNGPTLNACYLKPGYTRMCFS